MTTDTVRWLRRRRSLVTYSRYGAVVKIRLTRYSDPLEAVRAIREASTSACVEVLRRAEEEKA